MWCGVDHMLLFKQAHQADEIVTVIAGGFDFIVTIFLLVWVLTEPNRSNEATKGSSLSLSQLQRHTWVTTSGVATS